MKWYKHDSDAHRDPKMRKLRRKHGLEGVGLYWTLLELIVADVDQNNFTFHLEHDAEMIAEDVGLTRDKVEAIMRTMVDLGLFECSEGVITCLKLLRRMDSSQVKNPDLRKQITDAKQGLLSGGHGGVMTRSWQGHERTEKNRTEKNRITLPEQEFSSTEVIDQKTGEVCW